MELIFDLRPDFLDNVRDFDTRALEVESKPSHVACEPVSDLTTFIVGFGGG